MSDQQMLAAVEGAIQYILGGCVGEYEVNGRSARYLDINQLYEMRRKLQCSINRQTTGIFATVEIRGTRSSWPGW